MHTPEVHTPEATEATLLNRIFRDRDGNIAIAQKPNLSLLAWFVVTFLTLLMTSSNIHRGLEAVAFGSLFT